MDATFSQLEREVAQGLRQFGDSAYLRAWERAGCPGRDPRVDPLPGDVVLAPAYEPWKVVRREGERVRITWTGFNQNHSTSESLITWCFWTRGCTVLARAVPRSEVTV